MSISLPLLSMREAMKFPNRVMNLRAVPKTLSLIPSVFTGFDLQDLEIIKAMIRDAYPFVTQLSTEMLEERMESNNYLWLIDVRSSEEFAVSRLRGAVNLQTPGRRASNSAAVSACRRFSASSSAIERSFSMERK